MTERQKESETRIVVTGATGVLGRRVVPLLVSAGHEVTAVARGRAGDVRAGGATPVELDLFDSAAVTRMVDGHDAVVDLATRIPSVNDMARRSAWRDNDRLRTEAAATMATAVLATGARRYVCESYFGPSWTCRCRVTPGAPARPPPRRGSGRRTTRPPGRR